MNKNDTKILLVDDEPDILEIVGYNLSSEGYQVFTAKNGKIAITEAKKHLPHLIILDVMMPIMDGVEACEKLRAIPQLSETVITFLTARGEDYSQVAGFEAGADDYISKPIRSRVLLSRIKAILRRQAALTEEEIAKMEFDNLVIDRERFVVEYNGKAIQFPRKEFELLSFLATKPGRVFSRDEILENVWGNEVLVVDRTIDVHVRKIREKLEDNYIFTVKGVGYKFED